jgi:hypothetical protein
VVRPARRDHGVAGRGGLYLTPTMPSNTMTTGFRSGQHVQLHPATDRAMVGDRFGRVVKISRSLVQVEMFKSGHLIRVHPDKLLPMEPAARRVEIDLGRAGSIGKSRQSQK